MQGRCDNNPLDQAEDVCNECGGEYCSPCLVYPRGQKRPPVCKACAILKSGVRVTGRGEKWETTNRKGIRKRRKSVQAAAASDPQDNVFRFFDEEGSDVEVRDREQLAEMVDHEPIDEVQSKKSRRQRRKEDKERAKAAPEPQTTSVPVPDDAHVPDDGASLDMAHEGVEVEEFLADTDKPKKSKRRRADDRRDDDQATSDQADAETAASEDDTVDVASALSIINEAAAQHDRPTEPSPLGEPVANHEPVESPPTDEASPPRAAPRASATELLSKLREAGGGAQAVEPEPVPVLEDPWVPATTPAGPEPEPDPFFDTSGQTEPSQASEFSAVDHDPFTPAAADPFADGATQRDPDPFTADQAVAMATAPADDPFTPADPLPVIEPGQHNDPFAASDEPEFAQAPMPTPAPAPAPTAHAPSDDPFQPGASESDAFESGAFESGAFESDGFESAASEPAAFEPVVVEPVAQATPEPAAFESAPEPTAPMPAQNAPSAEPVSSTNPPAGAADRDADGNWIPPVLRGMAPVQERAELPKRRGS